MLNPSSLLLNLCGCSHIEVYNDPVQYLMRNSDIHSNAILEHINILGIASMRPCLLGIPMENHPNGNHPG